MKYTNSLILGKDIRIPEMSVYQYLTACNRFRKDALVICHQDRLNIKRLEEESYIYAKAFLQCGIKKSDVVLICLSPSIESVVFFCALNRIGAITVFLDALSNKKDIYNYCKLFSAKMLIASDLSDNSKCLEDKIIEKLIYISQRKTFDHIEHTADKNTIAYGRDDLLDIYSLKEMGNKSKCLINYEPMKEDAALITFTSGTTGLPKAIVLSNENIIAELLMEKKTTHISIGPRGNIMQVVPFNYPYGFIISVLLPIASRRTAVLTPLINLVNLRKYIDMYRPYMVCGIPSLYVYMKDSTEFENVDLSFLKYAISGGDKLSESDKENINDFFVNHNSNSKIYDGMGNGEGGGALTNTAVLFKKYNIKSIGMANYGLSVKFIDEKNEVVPIGEKGYFCFAGKNVMKEYFGEPLETEKVIRYENNRRWFHTDTIGHMDEDGWLYFDSRIRRFFITYDEDGSPYKVYCDHVQDIVEKCDCVKACAIVSADDSKRHKVPVAYVVLNSDKESVTYIRNRIYDFCKDNLKKYELPVTVEFIKDIPVTKAGKKDYHVLEEMAEKRT